jgi:hypothetical protein
MHIDPGLKIGCHGQGPCMLSSEPQKSEKHAVEPDRKDVSAVVKNLSAFTVANPDPTDWLRGIHLIMMNVKNMTENHLPQIIFNQLIDPGASCGQKLIRMLNQEQITLQKCTWIQFVSVFRSTFVSPNHEMELRAHLSRLKMKPSDYDVHAAQNFCLEFEKLYQEVHGTIQTSEMEKDMIQELILKSHP